MASDLLLHLPSSSKINKDCIFSQAKLKAKCKNTTCYSAGHTNLTYIHMNEVLIHDHELSFSLSILRLSVYCGRQRKP